ncbi:MAG: hypothetical protein JWL76_2167 [Thermoleophilia bacterium]|nr:hypothetical protein [Thermoleophilia bacterium]
MEARTRDLIFGTGRGADGMRGVFTPRSEPVKLRDLAATYHGPGAEPALSWAERHNLITAEQRAGNGAASAGAEAISDVATGTTRGLAGATSAAAGTQQYANPIYNGLMAQSLMREHGFVAPTAAPDGMILGGGVADDVRLVAAAAEPAAAPAATAPISAAADDVAAHVADLEQRMLTGLQRLGELPQDAKLPVLTRAVDATAQHGGDSYDVLARTLLDRPLDDAVVAFERSLNDAAKVVAPAIDTAAHAAAPVAAEVAAKVAAPVAETVAAKAAPILAETVAEVVAKAVPQVIEAAVPKVVEAATPSIVAAAKSGLLTGGSEGALRGVMSFSAGIDDTLRMLARF